MATIKLDVPKELESGEEIKFKATHMGWQEKGKDRKYSYLRWKILKGEGMLDEKFGKFTAPKLAAESVTEIEVSGLYTSAKVAFEVRIKKALPIEILPKDGSARCGEQIKFSSKSSFQTKPFFEIVKAVPEKGAIDPKTGLYTAPARIAKKSKVLIRVIDENNPDPKKQKNSDTAVVTLLPVVIKIGIQKLVIPGKQQVKLPIESLNDPNGTENFSCRIVDTTRPVGRLENGGIYLPPFRLDNQVMVKVEAVSKLDSSKKAVLEFFVGSKEDIS